MKTDSPGPLIGLLRRKRGQLLVLLLIGLAVLARFGPHLSLDAAIVDHDWYTMHSIDAMHVEQSFEEGQLLPTWSPYILGGSPLWGVSTKPFSYPPFLFAVWSFGAMAAMNVLLLLHALIGGIGCVLLAKRMGLVGPAPVLCGLLFLLTRFPGSGYQATPYGFGYAITWWPFFLIALLDLLQTRGTLSASARLAIFGALQWHAGGQPTFYWLACFSAVFALPFLFKGSERVERRKMLGGAALAALVFVGLIAVKLIPELSWIEDSGRGSALGMQDLRDSALEEELVENERSSRLLNLGLVLVEHCKGQGGWVLLIGTVLGLARARRNLTYWATLLATAFAFALASGAIHEGAYEWLLGYDRMRRHSRFVHMFGFGWILLAGHGFQFELKRSGAWVMSGVLVLAVFLDTPYLSGIENRPGRSESSSEYSELYAAVLAPVAEDERTGRIVQAHAGQPGWVSMGVESVSGALGGPKSGNRLYHEFVPELSGSQFLERTTPGILDVMNVRYLVTGAPFAGPGIEPIVRPGNLPLDVHQRVQALELDPLFVFRRLNPRARVSTVDAPTLVVGPESKRRDFILRTMSTKGYDAHEQVLVECPTTRVAELGTDWALDFPRILFLDIPSDDPALVDWASRTPAGQLRNDKRGAIWLASSQRPTQLTQVADTKHSKTMGTIDVDVDGLGDSLLLLAERTTLDPGWTATIDDAPIQMLRADGVVTLLRLPSGASKLKMRYTPPGRPVGMWITCMTILVVSVVAMRQRRTKRCGPAQSCEE